VQVLISIVTNAIQAFDVQDSKLLSVVSQTTDDSVRLDITDNAGGIDESILNKLFEPYFTTKHQANGTGLGLYISKMIIEESMHGELIVQNIEGGARFSIVIKNEDMVEEVQI